MTSTDNEAKRASGHADVPLSEQGMARAVALGVAYQNERIDAVISSDLQRATQTSVIAFNARGIPLLSDARLRECDYGSMTQFPVAQVEQEFPHRIAVPFPAGESLTMVVERVGAFLREVIHAYDGKTIVVIGHRAMKYALYYWAHSDSLEDVVNRQWEWLEIPIWRFQFSADMLTRGD